jgi:hypothetical protein
MVQWPWAYYMDLIIWSSVCYMCLGSNDCFVIGIALMGGHYRIYIISGMCHLRSDLVMPLVLWMVAYNI